MSEIRVGSIKAEDGISSPTFPSGIQVTGVVTATVLDATVPFLSVGSNAQLGNAGIITATGANISGNISAVDGSFSGNVSIAKTLTYEDVTNIDSVGLITARAGIKMTGGSLYVGGNSNFTGTLTGTATTSTTITVADESSDTTCFPVFATAATGSIAPKTGSNLSFNSNTGALTATSFAGSGSGITGVPAANLTGTAAAINGSNITNLNGSAITSGTVADARISTLTASKLTGALPAISGASLTGIDGGVLQVRQWVKNSTIFNDSVSDTVMAAPFDGSATITPSSAANMIKVTYFTTGDHGTTWRSSYHRLQYSTDGGSTYYGIAGGSMHCYNEGTNVTGNMIALSRVFHPNTTNAVKIRVINHSHGSGNCRRWGQYNNESTDNTNTTPNTDNSVVAVGHALLLEELNSSICTLTTIG